MPLLFLLLPPPAPPRIQPARRPQTAPVAASAAASLGAALRRPTLSLFRAVAVTWGGVVVWEAGVAEVGCGSWAREVGVGEVGVERAGGVRAARPGTRREDREEQGAAGPTGTV